MTKLKKTELSRAHILSMFGVFKWFDDVDLSLWKTRENEEAEPIRIPFKFSYAMGLNFPTFERFKDAFQKAMRKDVDHAAYVEDETELNVRLSEKKENRKPVRTPRGGYVIEDPDKYGEEFLALQEKHKEAIERRADFLAETESVEIYTVDPDDVPDILSPPQVRILIPMIRPKELATVTELNPKTKKGKKGNAKKD